MALIGYARVSTDEQRLDLQMDALLKAGCEQEFIYKEHASGANASRPQLGILFKTLRKGDVLVVYKIDRLARSSKHLFQMMEWLEDHDVGFMSLTESVDTTSPMGKAIFTIFAAIAQLERDLISERTKAGLAAARARGRRGGRKPKLDKGKAQEAAKMLEDNPRLIHEQVARMFDVSRATLYRSWERYGISVDFEN